MEGLVQRVRDPDKKARMEEELRIPPLPLAIEYLWDTYLRLRRRISSSGFGPSPIGWADIGWFVEVTGFRLQSWEVELLEEIDNMYLAQAMKKDEARG